MSRPPSIAILSTACRLPDANSPAELWANVVEGRRSFRRIPRERLDISRYTVDAIGEADSITQIRAGLLTNWNFDHSAFRIPKRTYEATDHTHWLALELASEAILAIGGIDRIDRTRTAVVVANTLAGEFSRSSLLRLRAPFLNELMADAAALEGLAADVTTRLRAAFEDQLRRHFPDPNEESLAGGLANTIAGRIANYFDLHGGAYSVDAACASSLVALSDAANLLASEQVDAVVLAAVDLSLDPFELVGFSRNGALATDEMRVFDAKSSGFWPGEGGACSVLMREKDALRTGLPVLARIRGWGLSSDGAGGLTRPSLEGQLLAYRRAYEMAQVDPADVDFVEAHGTGTAVGDPIEVRALAALREGSRSTLPIGSIKANIGHTKAAAGLAGLIKAVEALRCGVIPPHVSCENPHPVFAETGHRVRANVAAERIDDPRRGFAGVSSFGFGGINTHFVIERIGAATCPIGLPCSPRSQDAELFLFSGDGTSDIVESIETFEGRTATLSIAEFSDAAAYAASKAGPGPIRIAIVASTDTELAERLARAKAAVIAGETFADSNEGVFVGRPSRAPRIGFLFPGQGAPCRPDGGFWRRRFAGVAKLTEALPTASGQNSFDTSVAQPAIVAASLAALDVLKRLGISACAATGHSLGEISALAWAEALDPEMALELARTRGSIMARAGSPGGGMLRVVLPPHDAEHFARETDTVVACRNGRHESVLSGSVDAVTHALARCKDRGIEASRLAVSHAFHSPHMKPAGDELALALGAASFRSISEGTVISTITGAPLTAHSNLRQLLVDQLVEPVFFDAALEALCAQSDFLVEVGPGEGLTRLARSAGIAASSVDAFGSSIRPLLYTAGALFAAGANIRAEPLYTDRHLRTFEPLATPTFIESPCGSREPASPAGLPAPPRPIQQPALEELAQETTPLTAVLSAIVKETGLRVSLIGLDDRFLDALHLNSLAVTRIVIGAAKALRVRLPSAPIEFSNATARQLADALAELQAFGGDADNAQARIAGVRPWVQTYGMDWSEATLRAQSASPAWWSHVRVFSPIPEEPEKASDRGLAIWVEGEFEAGLAEQLVARVSAAIKANVRHLAICHHGAPISAFARSVAREAYFRSVRVIDCPNCDMADPRLARILATDVNGYYEVQLAQDGAIREPIFAPIIPRSSSLAAIAASDVVAIVGGGKGIAAECAFEIARCGAAIVLIGRSAASDPAVAMSLARAAASGLRCRYVCADVLDKESLRSGLAAVLDDYGPVTILLYAPALNQPKRLIELDTEMVRRTIALKTVGLESTLEVLGPQVRRLITFGSIIGRIGLEGEAHYALANAMQTAATEAWASASMDRTSLAIEWSVWGGTGMGERLGTIERLGALGVDALSVDDALKAFDEMITQGTLGTVAVTSRFGPPPDLSLGVLELPMLRFLDEPKIHFPGVELVVETTLSRGRDCYLEDHIVGGALVLPAVMGLEAMAQVACALTPSESHTTIGDIGLLRALNVPVSGAIRIRVAALRTGRCTTDVQIFSDDDGFLTPCMQASFSAGGAASHDWRLPNQPTHSFAADPLYGPLFFNGKSFQRLERFETATSRQVTAHLRPDPGTKWFGSFEPRSFTLWDPGATDAVLHALQVAVPHRQVIPVSVERVEIDSTAGCLRHVSAIERKTYGTSYTFDLIVSDANGRVAQRWINATFHAIATTNIKDVLAVSPSLVGPYLERLAREAFGDRSIEVSLICDRNNLRGSRRGAAIASLGLSGAVDRRADGKPIRNDSNGSVSISHCDDLTLVIAASTPIGCDMELLGADDDIDFIHRHTVHEACRKIGRKLPLTSIPAFIPNTPITMGDVKLFIAELRLPLGSFAVAFACLESPACSAAPARNQLLPREPAL
ncbi:MAG: SDR family NAD(P)-dependent oxidoreductase [Bradyrhizobium sp.]|uniref:type I polyketide synthase n=1 Tax=Bradyrhizobium sp. TaxID=376 RepID=UPI001A2FFEAB|nr:type I polyketide synthase [Bradyrhizobium sp.]MBJ7402116.1 SDR family NAD(P)-dependent oxidoreductase [Bradyrhizobium sp.]